MSADRVRGLLVRVDGTAELITVPNDFREINALIGAQWGEIVYTPVEGIILVVDEEGRVTNRPINPAAADLYPGVLCGDVFVTGQTLIPEPDIASLTDDQVELLRAWIPFASEVSGV